MAHAVESMFFSGRTPWHGLGESVSGSITSADAIIAAGLDWKISLEDLYTANGHVSDYRAAVRSSDGALINTVGPGWAPVQNVDAFACFDPIVTIGTATYETAGSLREGSDVWVLAKLGSRGDADAVSADDRLERYILLSNGHGRASFRMGVTTTRVVCANTLAASLRADGKAMARTSHTKNVGLRVDAIAESIQESIAAGDEVIERYRKMREIPLRKRSQLDAYLAAVVGPAEAKRQEAAKARGKRSKLATDVEKLFVSGRGTELDGVRGTAWGAFNALSEHMTHIAGRTKDRRKAAELRAETNMWGTGAATLSRAISDDVLKVLADRASADTVAASAPVDMRAATADVMSALGR